MADHAKPILTDNYTDVLSQIRGRFEDQAKGFDPANTTATNISTGTICWTSASNKWQKWSGTAWTDLSSLYAINISGNAATATNASTVTNGVYTVGDQTIAGVKTFSSTIQGNISGNAGTVTNGVYTTGDQTINGVKTFNSNTIFNGNLGLGVTPSAWGGGYGPVLEMKAGGSLVNNQSNNVHVANNCYYNGTNWIYKSTNAASRYEQFNGQHHWCTAPSGTAGNPISFTQAMTLDSNGNLGIGTSSPLTRLHVNGGITSTGSADLPAQVGVTAYFTGGYASPVSGRLVFGDGTGWTYRFARRMAGTTTDLFTFTDTGDLLVGNTNGTSRITASGVIESTTGGFKFPDGTTQTSAGINPATAAAGAVGTYALLRAVTSAYIYAGNTFAGSDLRWSSAGGNNSAGPVGTWRCLGQVAGGSANAADYVTLWVRIS